MTFLLWLVINALVGYAIGKRKDSIAGSIIISILLGPIGWLIAALWPGDIRRCPFCAENTRREAKVCKHCGRELPPPSSATPVVLGRLAIFFALFIGVIWLMMVLTRPTRAKLEARVEADKRQLVPNPPPITSVAPLESPTPKSITTASTPINFAVATATPVHPDPNIVTLRKPVSIAIQYGIVGIPAGTKLPLVMRSGDTVLIRYSDGADYEIPISATDLE